MKGKRRVLMEPPDSLAFPVFDNRIDFCLCRYLRLLGLTCSEEVGVGTGGRAPQSSQQKASYGGRGGRQQGCGCQ